IFLPAPEPKTALGRHRLLSPTAGVRVSPLQLGGGSLGSAWTDLTGAMTKEASFKLLDAFVEAGGNFIDTANNYQNEESELFIGEWMAERKNRDRIILATKFTTNYRAYADGKNESINNSGNHKKSLHLSLRDSLKKLQTDYIDILYWWDWTTSIEEVMHSLDILVKQGKVLYLGISDTPAWIVAAANTYAREKGLAPFVVYQGRWNVMDRAFERDIIPMAHHFGMALAVWNAMAGGHLQTKKQLEERKKNNEALRFSFAGPEQTEEEERFSALLAKIAAEHNIESVTAVALACESRSFQDSLRLPHRRVSSSSSSVALDRANLPFIPTADARSSTCTTTSKPSPSSSPPSRSRRSR
ncbi:NADP-dependent oxidoreductase domain-containing protein, partial [Leucosporidium creatinivorum]